MYNRLSPVLTADAMREADRRTIEDFGIPGFTLMETAGRAVARCARRLAGKSEGATIQILCGKGNNGGDGFVAARILHGEGYQVEVLSVTGLQGLTGDAAAHFSLLLRLAERSKDLRVSTDLTLDALSSVDPPALCIDALFGTGLHTRVREPLADIIRWMNALACPVLSVDIPSGLHSDTGRIMGVAVSADTTVTMAALKPGLLLNEGPSASGSVVTAEIGIPRFILDEVAAMPGSARLGRPEFVRRLLPTRTRSDHKYSSGPTLIFAGSDAFSGAPALAATAAARIGSGYVVAVCPPGISSLLEKKLLEIPVHPWSRSGDSIDVDRTVEGLGTRWEKARSVLIGPGLGRGTLISDFVLRLLDTVPTPVVIDADGLFALQGKCDFVSARSSGAWIFTPHIGEFERLNDSRYNPDDPVAEARKFAEKWNVVLLLKGMPSVVAAPDGRTIINDTGNPAAASAGSGDVLAGMIAGLLGRGLAPFDAAAAGIHLAGVAADRYAEAHASVSFMASDVLEMLPDILGDYG